jgi:hypothetical protein
MKLLKFEHKLRREDLFAVSITMILMWLVYIDILWVWSHLFAVLSVGYVIAIYYILNEKSFEKNVLNIVLKFIGFSEGFLGLLSGYSVLAIMTLTKHETTIFYNFLYIFPL